MNTESPGSIVSRQPSGASSFIASILVAVVVLVSFICSTPVNAATKSEHFPVPPAIRPNVDFWEKVYTTYSTSQAVIHDNQDLTKIYEVVPIVDSLLPQARQLNKPRIQAAEQKYTAILAKLANGISPASKDEHRIAAMYHGAGRARLLAASEAVRTQIGQKERFREGVLRSAKYIHEIKRILRSYNLPEELAYLPHVESSFNPKAYSKVGASGLWQFTRSTGTQYLRINKKVDERLDPILATHAAAKLLKSNYSALGNWPMALTAYNYGTSGMVRAKNAKGSYEKIFLEYQEGYFKFASRNFYSEFLAAMQAAKKMEPQTAAPSDKTAQAQTAPVTTVRITSNTSIHTISRHFNVDIHTIKTLNPTITPAILQGKRHVPKGYQLKLPATSQNEKKQTVTGKTSSHPKGGQTADTPNRS